MVGQIIGSGWTDDNRQQHEAGLLRFEKRDGRWAVADGVCVNHCDDTQTYAAEGADIVNKPVHANGARSFRCQLCPSNEGRSQALYRPAEFRSRMIGTSTGSSRGWGERRRHGAKVY